MNIAAKIRELRTSRGLSLRGLARRSRISAGHLASVEAERFAPGISTLLRLCEGLSIDMQRLLTLTSLNVLLEDDFVIQVARHLRSLNPQQREHLLRTLAAAPTRRRLT